jgi:precorrin-3B C17-methyltransferase
LKKLIVAGIGAGNYEGMTVAAVKALESADLIVGYTVYCDLIKPYFKEKKFLSTPMMKEIERCRLALEHAASGELTVMICSGDAGIYGMASPVLSLAGEYGVEVEIIPGVTAASSGASLLGSPLTCDFAVVSLSDLLTPWELIEKRLRAAAQGDFAIAIYNPSSHKRRDYLRKACDILLETAPPERPCGYVRNIGREGTQHYVCTLEELRDTSVDMFTTVFIGDRTTRILNGRLVTPRGYDV